MSADITNLTANLPKTATQDLVESIFLPFGNILGIEMSKNTAIVHYEEAEDCTSAILNTDGYECNGTFLSVKLYAGA